MICFSTETHCQKISADGAQYCHSFFIKKCFFNNLVTIVKGYGCGYNEKLLVRSPLGDIDIIVLFMLHYCCSNLFLDTGHDDARKIVDISCPMLLKIEYQGLSKRNAFSGKKYISNFFRKSQQKVLENIEVSRYLGTNKMFLEDTLMEFKSFVCKIYGDKKFSSVNEVQKCQNLRRERNY